jgi:hypothetical protein
LIAKLNYRQVFPRNNTFEELYLIPLVNYSILPGKTDPRGLEDKNLNGTVVWGAETMKTFIGQDCLKG